MKKGTEVRWKKGSDYSRGRVESAYAKAGGNNHTERSKKAFLIKGEDGSLVLKMDDEIEIIK